MSRKLNLVGQRFGRLIVIEEAKKEKSNNSYWRCRCDCGNETTVIGTSLTSGHTTSCGCKKIEETIKRNTTHGESNTRLYSIWRHMIKRTENPHDERYKYYGGRGIKVCEEWHDYSVFSIWAKENGYDDSLTIERIDVNGNYCPENCTWATKEEQANNKRYCIYVLFMGEKRTLAECSRLSGINYNTLITRYKNGDTGNHLFRPVKQLNHK